MVQLITILSTILAAGFAIAQEPNASFNSSVVSQVAGELDPGTASAWCNAQYHACNVLCGKASVNQCTTPSLTWNCTCASNNSAPALQYYNPTIISNICNRYLGDCLKNNAGSQAAQANCQQTIVCGNSSVDAYANRSTTTSSSSSATMSATSSPLPSKNAAALLDIGANYGTGLVGTIVLGVVGFVL